MNPQKTGKMEDGPRKNTKSLYMASNYTERIGKK
jgi:hypothetical protein